MTNKTLAPDIDAITLDIAPISEETLIVFTWVLVAGVCQAIAIFGVITNILNIMCFLKQGFKEPVNISLFGLAVADLGCLLTQVVINMFYTLAASTADLPFDVFDVAYLAVAMPHLAFSRVNSWVTVIITLERCLCITVPLKMKHIVTTKRLWILISCIYIVFLLSGAPVFFVNKLDTKFSLTKNRTLIGLVSTTDRDKVEEITFTINSFFLPFSAFITISICTAILVVNLRKRTKWLKTSSNVTKCDFSNRDQKVAKMVVIISVLFIVCFLPLAVIMVASAFEPDLKAGGKLFNICKLLGNIALLMESVNSSANIFIYHRMSQKYRETFHLMFGRSIKSFS